MNEPKSGKPLSGCACMNMRRASRSITKIYDQALKASGLKSNQFSLLMAIKTNGPLNISALAKKQCLDRTTLVRNLKHLETNELIESTKTKDLRERQIIISKLGLQIFDKALPLWKTIQQEISDHIGTIPLQVFEQITISLESFSGTENK
ncbi:hypothetical protein A7E78_00090 [Syntrophotalea acetylenivorans]|uniref:HTH marR-type domain-containing protein n=1 Tax=Syntrophotalea acetylenivorans TaxID=1842532 RepID=A0A1L3GKF8_9BACT|nr:MarR family transcriptional regulator [Syntrophotalea acetylenivorans]APG26404.1 hypothetical protein A7E78_00090 [Syntrophotalea acetylenivorans]